MNNRSSANPLGPSWAARSWVVATAVVPLLLLPSTVGAANHTVEARASNTFFPAALTIEVGDTVTFVNTGGTHNVRANDSSFRCSNGCDASGGNRGTASVACDAYGCDASGTNGDPASNAWSFTLTFNDPGTIGYSCEVHGVVGMVGSITVQGASGAPGNLRFATASQSRTEGGGAFTVNVSRVGGDDGAVSVSYATSNGSAQAGSDYTAVSGTLNWADGDDDNKSFQVPILDDAVVESNETINAALSNPSGGAGLAAPSNATLTIQDDDDTSPQPGQLGFVSSQFSVSEDQGVQMISVQRTGGAEGAVSVDYATAEGSATDGVDYTGAVGSLQWANGESGSKNFDVGILDDAMEENTESVNLTLSGPTGGATLGTSSATLEIHDDDAATECVEDETTLCLRSDKRFRVTVDWRTPVGTSGPGRVIPFAPVDSGLFWFFDADNAEVLIKLLDGCAINNHFWVFAAASTDVEYTLHVTDTQAGETSVYFNTLGTQAPAVTDTSAFATCP